MQVELNGKTVTLRQQDVISSGGEGTVFLLSQRDKQLAIKLYHTPTLQHQEKLLALTSRTWQLPSNTIAMPQQPIRDVATSQIIGLAMPYFHSPIAEVALLANKKQRAARGISTRQIASIFLDAGRTLNSIHRAGLVVGDLNDQNLLFREQTALWIDVDSWQFDMFPCSVACEDYLAPELYGVDLSASPTFTPAHDWYAFAVLLFRSLLLVHPYGGTYPQLPLLTQRAQQHLFVLQPEVAYPKFAYPSDLVSDSLLHSFERYFRQGWRGPFPLDELEDYYADLVMCHMCGQDYPCERSTCPHCQARTRVITQTMTTNTAGLQCNELLRTDGSIIFHALQNDTLFVIAYEQGNAILYRKRPLAPVERMTLFKALPGAQYALVGDVLIVNPADTTRLLCLNISGTSPHPLYQSATTTFTGTRRAIFQGSQKHLFSILNHSLVASSPETEGLSSRPLRAVMDEHTWFSVAPSGDVPALLGYFQIFRQQLFWLQHGSTTHELHLAPLHQEETLLDLAVHFSQQNILLRRHTQERGIDYLRTDILSYQGDILHALPRSKRADHPAPILHGTVYAEGMLLHASEQGIIQERVVQQTYKTFANTQRLVREGSSLAIYQSGLLIIDERQVLSLTL